MRACSAIALMALLLAACGGGNTDRVPEYFMQGTFTIDGGQPFTFVEACRVSATELAGEAYRGMEAEDLSAPLGLVVTWRQAFVTGPGTFDANAGLTDLYTSIVRAHPTDESKVRISTVGEGSVIFEQVGYQSGDLISGRLEDIVMERTDPDDTIHITFGDGSFHCLVP